MRHVSYGVDLTFYSFQYNLRRIVAPHRETFFTFLIFYAEFDSVDNPNQWKGCASLIAWGNILKAP